MVKRRWTKRIFWALFATVTVSLALLTTAARMLFPHADDYRHEVESWVGTQLGQPLRIGGIDARWRYIYPELILHDVELLDRQGKPLNTLSELNLGLDVVELVRNQQVSFVHLGMVLDKLTLQRDEYGQISIREFPGAIGGGSSEPDESDAIFGWLLQQGNLKLTISEFSWLDAKSLVDYRFSDVTLDLSNDGRRHQLSANIQLPFVMGASLDVALEIVGDPLRSGDWLGRLYLAGEGISLPHWLFEQQFFGQTVSAGSLDFALWSEWYGLALTSLQGEVALYDLELESLDMARSRKIGYLRTGLDWQRLSDGWQLGLDDLALNYQQHSWAPADHALRVATTADGEQQFAGRSGYLHLGDLHDLLDYLGLFSNESSEILSILKPQGELYHLQGQYLSAENYHVEGELREVTIQPWQELPGVENITAKVVLQTDRGDVQLLSRDARLDWPDMFREPLPLTQLEGAFTWYKGEQGLMVNSPRFSIANQDLAAEGALGLQLKPESAPFIDLAINFMRADASQTARYLPVGIMPESVVEWLDQGILSGRVTGGGMLYHGMTNDFPFRNYEGVFDVDFEVEKVLLSPEEGWQPISDIDGNVRFYGPGMEINADHGLLLNSTIRACQVAINDLQSSNHYLSISGQVEAITPDISEYLLSSPFAGQVDYLQMFHVEGRSEVDLALEIPLGNEGEFAFNAFAQLKDNNLEVVPAELTAQALNGLLHVSSGGLEIEQITGMLYGQPISVGVQTLGDAEGESTLLKFEGGLSGEGLTAYLEQPLFAQLMSGESTLRGELYIPHREGGDTVLHLESDLQGLAVELPGTLAKSAEIMRKLTVNLRFPSQAAPLMQLDYGHQLGAILSFDKPRLRGQLILGEQTPHLPELPGLEIAGQLSNFSLSELLDRLPLMEPSMPVDDLPGVVRNVDLKVGNLELFSQVLTDVELLATQLGQQWLLELQSQQAKGRFEFSENLTQSPVKVVMEHLSLTPFKGNEGGDVPQDPHHFDMHQLPPLQIEVQQLTYGELPLGNLTVLSHWQEGRYLLDELLLHPNSASLRLQGEWYPGEDEQGETQLLLSLESNNFGRTISGLGYAGSMEKGKGAAHANLRWQGGVSEFAMARLNGEISFNVEDGRILDVEPGAGRILGLLSIQMLPRRLLLDFSDLFAKGFSFDEIRGQYKLQNGVATTDNFTMLGASARVDMLGDVDLAKRSYNQRLIITPFVTESLPLLSFLTGLATPQVAAAIFLTQKLFSDDLEKIAQFEYRVTGPWDNPKIEKIREEKVERPAVEAKPPPATDINIDAE